MKEVWELAVKFLSAKDSRVRVESQRIAGEDFEVWRLLHHGSPSSPQSSTVEMNIFNNSDCHLVFAKQCLLQTLHMLSAMLRYFYINLHPYHWGNNSPSLFAICKFV